ncbi:MAG TPA: ABC transporter ATP-binding protein [Desulfobacterales bacterium]|nr:ABC transporter ATP-binding protein [Desulfobacterales bacterium]
MDNNNAINLSNITKTYNLYNSHTDRVKETFHPLRKKYNHPFNALENVALSVRKGSSIGIIGRNGSGKSTLLQIICGILKPTAGTVEVIGRISALLELGAGFNPDFTGVENVYLSASILGIGQKETEKKFEEIVEFAEIGEFINQPVKTYSSGMYIRLAFAIAVNMKPEILVVDEALAVGDIFFQQKCIQHMQQLMQNCTKIIATHDMQAVANLCERILVLDQGKVIFEGSPLKGIEYYTKIMHNKRFKKSCEFEPGINKVNSIDILEENDWVDVSEDSRAGACEIIIEKLKITSKECVPINIVKADDYIIIHLIVNSLLPKEDVIFGYLIKDRVGNAVFGENTIECPTGAISIQKGRYRVQFGFKWPEVYPEKYTITVGIGEGNHPSNHTIQCWAHNLLAVSAISPNRFIHAMFNNPITHMTINPVR